MTRRLQGMNAWILQRISAGYLALFVFYILFVFIFQPPDSYTDFKSWLAHPFMNICTLLFFAMIFGHIWVGIRDVFMDYIPSLFVRAIVLIIFAFSLIACGIWVIQIMFMAML